MKAGESRFWRSVGDLKWGKEPQYIACDKKRKGHQRAHQKKHIFDPGKNSKAWPEKLTQNQFQIRGKKKKTRKSKKSG